MTGVLHPVLGLALALAVGCVLGLLGGGGSILALPIFLYVFGIATNPAIAMSLAVVGTSAFIGFLGHWRQGTVSLRIALPYGVCAMVGGFAAARLAHLIPVRVKLSLFVLFAATAAMLMLRDSLRARSADDTLTSAGESTITPLLALQGFGVGLLTAIIGAGGGFVIVPALVLLAKLPVRVAVGSSLLVIAMNSASAFSGYIGLVPIQWSLVTTFTLIAAIGVVIGTRLVPYVPQARLKQGFAVMILVLGSYFVVRELRKILSPSPTATRSASL